MKKQKIKNKNKKNVRKLKRKCDNTQKLKIGHYSKTQNVTKLKM